MATFRQIMQQSESFPGSGIYVDNTASQLFGTLANAAQVAESAIKQDINAPGGPAETIRALAASAQAQEQELRLATQEADKKTKEYEQYGLPAMVGNLSPEQLQKVLDEHPGLSPQAQAFIADGVAKKRASEDVITLQQQVLADPSRNVSDHLNSIIQTRLQSFNNPRSAGQYQIAMNEHAQNLMSRAVAEQADKNRLEAIDGHAEDFANKVAFDLNQGMLPDTFKGLVNEFITNVSPLSPNASKADLRSKALATVMQQIAGGPGQSIGIDPSLALSQVQQLNEKMGLDFPQLAGLASSLQNAVAKQKLETANQVTEQLKTAISSADNSVSLDGLISQKKNLVNLGTINRIQAIEIDAAVQKQTDKLANFNDVNKALGLKTDKAGNIVGDFKNPNDNVQVNIGPQHDEAIDTIANRLGLQGEQKTVWQMANFGRLTDSTLKDLKQMGEASNPATFASGLNQFNLIYKNNPAYAMQLLDEKKLPNKLEVASVLATIGGQDINAAVQRVAGVSELDLAQAKALLTPKTKAERTALGLTDNQNYWDISRKLIPGGYIFGSAGGSPSADAQRLYAATFQLTAAQYQKVNGQADHATIYKVADQMATDLLKAEFTPLTVGPDTYLVPNNKKSSWGLVGPMWDQIGSLWAQEKVKQSLRSNIPADQIKLDLENMYVDPANKMNYIVPIRYYDFDSGQMQNGGTFTFPRTRPELKKAVEEQSAKEQQYINDNAGPGSPMFWFNFMG